MPASPPSDQPLEPSGIDWDAGGIETELGWSLQAMSQGFARIATGAVADVPGGPRGYQVLVAITTEAPTSQLVLAQRLGIDKTAMVYVVDALEGASLVERRPDPRDRRVRQVLPTDQGRALLGAARAALRGVEGQLMRNLSPEEQEQLRRLMARVALDSGAVESCIGVVADTEQPVASPHLSARRRRADVRDTTPPEKSTPS
ncbi:MarR family winged helix-turn-helix transcriptional regulator [Arthrobacter sp. NPDC092385]|uniref:MarR family winged helix-turn-helix transcriptional regulator n=1 Tax=Arthrobacter sp. NPDC092385 TaxID=3363943 RepID=UPI00383040D2